MVPKPLFDFSFFPTLATKRLTLRELRLSDAADVLIFRGDPTVQLYNGPIFQSVSEVHLLIEELRTAFKAQEGITWAVTIQKDDIVVGLFSLHHWNLYHRRAEVGFDLARVHWGIGIGSEALQAIVTFGFENLALHRIYADTIADNHAAVRLLEKLGFYREGTKRQNSWEEDGTFHDSAIYGLLVNEFLE